MFKADLSAADLFGTIGNMKEIRSMQLETYTITFTKDVLQIGCKNYSHSEWQEFTDDQIDEMADNAIEFWHKWKDFIFKAIELSFGDSK